MTHWTPQDWMLFFGSLATFLGAATPLVIAVIKALKENTEATKESTAAHLAAPALPSVTVTGTAASPTVTVSGQDLPPATSARPAPRRPKK